MLRAFGKLQVFFVLLMGLGLGLPLALPSHAQQAPSDAGGSAAATPTPTPDPKRPIKMELSSPFALAEQPFKMQSRWGCWLPVQVTLSNTGDPVSGRLEFSLVYSGDAARGSTTYTEVDLPTVSNKQVWIYARVDREFDGGVITFSGRGISTLKEDFPLEKKNDGTRVVVSVSADNEKIGALQDLKKPESLGIKSEIDELKRSNNNPYAYNYGNNRRASSAIVSDLVKPLAVTQKNLPPRWVGLQMADAVVLQDFPHAELSAAQQEALRGYVASGGALIAIGGADWDRLARSPLADLWPVAPTSASPAGNEQKQAFYRRYVQNQGSNDRALRKFALGDDLAGAPLMLTQSTLRPGAKTIWGTAMPMMATRPYGAGRVLFLAGDPNQPPFAGWRGTPYLWSEVFANTPTPNVLEETSVPMINYYTDMNPDMHPGRADPTFGIFEELRRVRQLKTPPVSTIAWFLALYVFFLVPVNYCVLRMLDKRELAWVTVPVIVVAFSFMSYAAALRIKGSTLLARQINMVQGSGTFNGAPTNLEARADSMLWLFSPRKTSYAIGGDSPQLVVSHYVSSKSVVESPVTIAETGEDKPLRVEDAALNYWDYRAFVGHATVNTKGGVQVTAQGSGENQKPQVKNASPFDMKGVVLKWHERLWACGDMKAGATVTGEMTSRTSANGAQLAAPMANISSLARIFPTGGSDMKPAANNALSMALNGPSGDADAVLIGWSTQPVAGLTIEDTSPAFDNATLFVYEIN